MVYEDPNPSDSENTSQDTEVAPQNEVLDDFPQDLPELETPNLSAFKGSDQSRGLTKRGLDIIRGRTKDTRSGNEGE